MFNALLNNSITSDGLTNFTWELLTAARSITTHFCAVNSITIKSKRFLNLGALTESINLD